MPASRSGGDLVVVASGPSLARWQCDYIRDKARAVATNTSFRAVAPGSVVYGCDHPWWQRYHRQTESYERWTQDAEAAAEFGLNYIRSRPGEGLATEPGLIHQGCNSGYQAINLAWHFGAERIILIGFDMQHTGGRTHWHGDHPKGLANAQGVERWRPHFTALARDLARLGVPVINCSLQTALACFERADLRDVL